MKYLIGLALFCAFVLARPPDALTEIVRPYSPMPSDIQLQARLVALIKERRKTPVSLQDSTVVALMEALHTAYAVAQSLQDNAMPNQVIEDHDLRCAIKYLDNESVKIKIL